MRLRLIVPFALAATACSSEPAAKQAEPKAAAVTPVLSDGVRPFENADMGIRAYFPPGDRVCLARSGDAARGFYARYGTTDTGCPQARDKSAFMGVSAMFNAPGYPSVEQAVSLCGRLTIEMTRRFGGKAPAFPGHRSIACLDPTGGSILITVHALAGKSRDSRAVPRVLYSASLGTRADRLDRDVPMFRTFLKKLQIGLPPRAGQPQDKNAAE